MAAFIPDKTLEFWLEENVLFKMKTQQARYGTSAAADGAPIGKSISCSSIFYDDTKAPTRSLFFHFKGRDAGHGVHGPEEAVQDRERVGGEEAAVPENPGRARGQKS